jgi:RNA polymerase sigma-32 factor
MGEIDDKKIDGLDEAEEIEETPLVADWLNPPEGEEGEGEVFSPESDESAPASREVVHYDPLQNYLMEIRKYPLLSKEEEYLLAVAYRDKGNLEAVSRLILANLRFVVHIAMEYRNSHFNLMDLIQEGNIGLMQGVKKYDPYRGGRLSNYVAWWIRAYILRYILNNWRQVKIGTTQAQRKLFFRLKKEKEKLESMGYEAGPKLLAHHLNVREKDVVEMEQRLGAPDLSLSEPRYEGGEESLAEYIPSDDLAIDERLVQEEATHLLRKELATFEQTLSPRDLDIFKNRILSENPKTLAEIGRIYGISRERARQIEEQIIKRLRERLTPS